MSTQKKMYYSPNMFQSYGEPEIKAVTQVLKATPEEQQKIIEKFEKRVSELFKAKYGVFVNSGSSANLLACMCAGFKPGDEVITPACTFPTTVSPIIFLGATPVFCDIAPGRYVPSIEQVMEKVTEKTKAVLIPDLVGDKFDYIGLRKALGEKYKHVILIEDACDTITSCNAEFATVSFYASHVISAGGCGGMVFTNNFEDYQKLLKLRNDSLDCTAPYYCAEFGYQNSLRFEDFKKARMEHFEHYWRRLGNSTFYELPTNHEALWLSMALICKSHRYEIVEQLEARGIQTRLCMAGNILRQPFYARMFPNIDPAVFVNTDKVFAGGILIGLHQGLSSEDVDWICDQLEELAKKYESE